MKIGLNTKSVILVLISGILAAAIYSRSVSNVLARIACSSLPKDPTSFTCADDKKKTITLCVKTKTGYDCQYLTKTFTDTNIPPALNDAIGAATQETQKYYKSS